MSVRKTPNCLILGGNGFLGSHLAGALLGRGCRVRVFDRATSGVDRLERVAARIDRMTGDIDDEKALRKAMVGMEYVFIFASFSTPATSMEMGTRAVLREHRMVRRILAAAADANVKRIIFPSSGGGIYGNTTVRKTPETARLRPLSPHTVGKLYAEKTLGEFKLKYGLDFITYRISNPYGERQGGSSSFGIVPALMKAAYDGSTAVLYGDSVRDYIYVGDMARIVADTFDLAHAHEVYNLGSGEGTRLSTLARIIESVAGKKIRVQKLGKRPFDVNRIVLDTSRIVREFHLAECTPLAEGLARTYADYCALRERDIISLPVAPRPVRIRNLSFSFGTTPLPERAHK